MKSYKSNWNWWARVRRCMMSRFLVHFIGLPRKPNEEDLSLDNNTYKISVSQQIPSGPWGPTPSMDLRKKYSHVHLVQYRRRLFDKLIFFIRTYKSVFFCKREKVYGHESLFLTYLGYFMYNVGFHWSFFLEFSAFSRSNHKKSI